MIAANELRRGNYCLFDSTIDRVTEIYETGCNAEFKSRWSYDRIHPIPLTPEILEKAGFVKAIDNQNNECYELKMSNGIDSYGLYLYEKSVGLFHKGALIGGGNIYLHQLQNLYFALTGQELTIKL